MRGSRSFLMATFWLPATAIGHLILWDAKSGAVLRQSKGPFVKHGGLAVLPDGQRVLTADQDGVVRMWTPRAQ